MKLTILNILAISICMGICTYEGTQNNFNAVIIWYVLSVVFCLLFGIRQLKKTERRNKLKWQDEILLKAYKENALHGDFYDKWIEEEYINF